MIDIRRIYSAIGSRVSKLLIRLHTFTWYDSVVSAFDEKAKIHALELIKTNEDARERCILEYNPGMT